MTIYGRGYRRLEYAPTTAWRRLWPVAGGEYRTLLRRRLGVVAFLLCLVPSIVNLGIMLLQTGVWQLGPDREWLAELRQQFPRNDPEAIDFYLVPIVGEVFSFVIFVMLTSLVSCRAIAKDRESNALEIYWTRGIGPGGYFFAKWLGSFLLVATPFVAAPALIWVLGVLMAPDWGMLERTVAFVPRVLLALALFTAALSYVAVAFSAMAGTANFATLLWLFLILGTAAVGRVLARVLQGEWWLKAINPWDAAKRLAECVAGYTPREDYDPLAAAAALALVLLGVTAGVLRRMRATEALA